ncbi:MAG: DUF3795 domain-containing protein [Thermodesulfobacteriota bacterium]
MQPMISCCGLFCHECPAFLATVNDDAAARAKTAEEWSRLYRSDFKPEDINCRGCRSEGQVLFNYCRVCEIRRCVLERGMENCGRCPDYACERLTGFFQMAPEARTNLERIRKETAAPRP